MFRYSSGRTTVSCIIVAAVILMTFISGIILSYKLSGGSASKIILSQKIQINSLMKQLSNWKKEFQTSSCRIIERPSKEGIPIQFTIFSSGGFSDKPLWKDVIFLKTPCVSIEYKIVQFTNEKIDEGKFCLYLINKVNGISVQDNPRKRYDDIFRKYSTTLIDALIEVLEHAEKYTDNDNLLKIGIRCKSEIIVTYEIKPESVYINSISVNGALFHDEFFM